MSLARVLESVRARARAARVTTRATERVDASPGEQEGVSEADIRHTPSPSAHPLARAADCKPLERPEGIKTHLRNMIIVPEMIGSVIGVYNGKTFNGIEVKPEMVGMYLGEFSITYKPVRHGRPGIGSTNSSRFIPLK